MGRGCVVRSSWWCCYLACGRGHLGAEVQRSENFVFAHHGPFLDPVTFSMGLSFVLDSLAIVVVAVASQR